MGTDSQRRCADPAATGCRTSKLSGRAVAAHACRAEAARADRVPGNLTSRQRAGSQAEAAALEFLRSRGLAIIARNFLRRAGELDIVARDSSVLVIAEIRTRACERFGGAAASVNRAKQRRIVRAANQLLQRRRELAALPVRFDVIVVHAPGSSAMRVEWIRHAFTA